MRGRKFPAIYKITHIPTGHFYIGKSTNVCERWHSHLSQFFASKHTQQMQELWDSSHYDNWTFQILKICKVKELEDMEQKYIAQAVADLAGTGDEHYFLNVKDNPFYVRPKKLRGKKEKVVEEDSEVPASSQFVTTLEVAGVATLD